MAHCKKQLLEDFTKFELNYAISIWNASRCITPTHKTLIKLPINLVIPVHK